MTEFRGQTALITGASTGIGAEFARQLAARGSDLVLVARGEQRLRELAADLTGRHGVRVEVVPADLAAPGAGAELKARLDQLDLDIDILVNNAGFGVHGAFSGSDLPRQLAQVQLNCTAVVELTGSFLPAMVERRHGTIINVASTAGYQPLPRMAVYGATKAFVLSFTEALWAEHRDGGVAVLALCPGATDTPFHEIAGEDPLPFGGNRSPAQVVATALRGLERGWPSAIDGRRNAALAHLVGFSPRRMTLAVARRIMRARATT